MEINLKFNPQNDQDLSLLDQLNKAFNTHIVGPESEPEPEQTQAPEPEFEQTQAPEPEPEQTQGVETDSDGLPWDHRIHASTKTKTKSGQWKKRRGVDDEEFDRIVTELKQTMDAGKPNADPLSSIAPPPPPQTQTPEPEQAQAPEPEQAQAPEPEQATVADFPTLLRKVQSLRTNGKMNQSQFEDLFKSFGLPSFPSFAQRPELIPDALDVVDQYE